ncbi:MAG TPA: tRNA (adenosine(37)-N6)-threonylcarbamoyltransferase complex transferase subunit TsaD, partial [Microbacteriaceae bacterium]|nr:tRNA (adenosine(37)-N6)-threonylcarbamoyltransferase complex transferase subunit TsaD [Microbacteriaceae bacterium]
FQSVTTSARAVSANQHAVPLPRPLVGSAEPHFSFAGLKSAVARAAASGEHRTADLAASFQQAVVDCLVDRSRIALAACPRATAFVVAGGVAANGAIRTALADLAHRFDRRFVAPPLWLCTDNGAMIAALGAQLVIAGRAPSGLAFGADSTLPATVVQS